MSTAALASPLSRRALPRVELYRLVGDEDRLALLALCAEEELTVGELSELTGESQPNVSRKVGPLRQAGLLNARREGTKTLLRVPAELKSADDPVLADALAEGRRLCMKDGSLARVPQVVGARDAEGRRFFEASPKASAKGAEADARPGTWLAHLSALSLLLPERHLAVDVGTGEGALLDLLAPLFDRVIAVDRSRAQLARCAQRVAERGFAHVSLLEGSYEDAALLERVSQHGGADLVVASRTLHHAARPGQAVLACARLLKPGAHFLVVDYSAHDDEAMRAAQADVWLGFPAGELEQSMREAGLQLVGARVIPAALHREGPDSHLEWRAWLARRPAVPLTRR